MGWWKAAERRWQQRMARRAGGSPIPVVAVATTRIARSCRDVWALVSRVENTPLTVPGAVSGRVVPGDTPGVLRHEAVVLRVDGRERTTFRDVLVEQPPRHAMMRSALATPPSRTSLWLDPAGDGCQARWEVEVQVPVMSEQSRAAYAEALRHELTEHARRVKQVAEYGSYAP